MFWNILDWLMMLFALISGISKVIGIKVERQGAKQFGLNYSYIIVMGLLQLLAIPLIYFHNYLAGVILLGLPYLYFTYLGIKHKQRGLSLGSFFIFCVTILRWLAFIW